MQIDKGRVRKDFDISSSVQFRMPSMQQLVVQEDEGVGAQRFRQSDEALQLVMSPLFPEEGAKLAEKLRSKAICPGRLKQSLSIKPDQNASFMDLGQFVIKQEEEEKDQQHDSPVDQQKEVEMDFKFRQETQKLMLLEQKYLTEPISQQEDEEKNFQPILKKPTAEFPKIYLDRSPLNNSYSASKDLREEGEGTPRFPTDSEIKFEERKMLLTFAFPSEAVLQKYVKDIFYIQSLDEVIELPKEEEIDELKSTIEKKGKKKKTLIFCNIEGLFYYATSHANQIRKYDCTIKQRKEGISRKLKVFFRPDLYSFLMLLKTKFELVLYVKEESDKVEKELELFDTLIKKNQVQTQRVVTMQIFDYILTQDHCVHASNYNLYCRSYHIFLSNRNLKDIVFISSDTRDLCLVHRNGILVQPYTGTKMENSLQKLKIYLCQNILNAGDVRDVIKRDFLCHIDEIEKQRNPSLMVSKQFSASQPKISNLDFDSQKQSKEETKKEAIKSRQSSKIKKHKKKGSRKVSPNK